MISKYIYESLKLYKVKTLDQFENVLRELVQEITICALAKSGFFNKAAFYGGTCLRMFYGLGRFSEDLDFSVIKENVDFKWDDYIGTCKTMLESFGLETQITAKEGYDAGEVRRRLIKIPYYEIAQEYFGDIKMNKEKLLIVKLEISTEYTEGAKYEIKTVVSPYFASVLCYDYSSLYAGKVCALLTRNWKNRVKGRDFYDYMFYLKNKGRLNLIYLQNKLKYSMNDDKLIVNIEWVRDMLVKLFNETNFESVKEDILPFINDDYYLEGITRDNFINSTAFVE